MTAISEGHNLGHHKLHNRYRIEGRLALASPLRLSSGRAADDTDAPLMRDRAGTVYIPGSSLRGALRSEMERVLAGVGPASGLRSCILFSAEASPFPCISVDETKQKTLIEKSEDQALAYLDAELCDLCRLFGSPAYASRLTVEDSYPEEPETIAGRTNVRDGVGIDRDTGAARESVKFDYEVLEAEGEKTFFKLCLRIENLGLGGAHDATLLNLALSLLAEGLHVGGKRSAGLGRITLDRATLKVTGFKSPQDLWAALQARKDPHQEMTLDEVLHAQA